MSVRPEELLATHARSREESRKVTARIPLELLREVWRFGVDFRSRSEGEALVAALRDWVARRQPPTRPRKKDAAEDGESMPDRDAAADLARRYGFVVFDPSEIDLTEPGLQLEAGIKKQIEDLCRRWIGELTRCLRAGLLPHCPTPDNPTNASRSS
jgi:hypothetical protein